MKTTIIFFLALIISIFTFILIIGDLFDYYFNPEGDRNPMVTEICIGVFASSFLWSYLFNLLH